MRITQSKFLVNNKNYHRQQKCIDIVTKGIYNMTIGNNKIRKGNQRHVAPQKGESKKYERTEQGS